MRIADGHLDLAMNALRGRDLTLTLDELRAHDPVTDERATITFAELEAAGTQLCFATLFAAPYAPDTPAGYRDAAGARAQALAQFDQYQRWQDAGRLRLLSTAEQVREHLARPQAPLGAVLLMEGADPIAKPDELPEWAARGVRVIGPAWGRTRYAGGTDAPGPLSAEGRELVQGMRELGLTLDASHLDDEAFWDAAEIGPGLIATHSNSRARVPGNRQLSDEMARAVAASGGVVGLVMLSRFIQSGQPAGHRAPLGELLRHAEHYAALIGWESVGLGSDLDGGFGAERAPAGIERYRDVTRFLELLPPEHRRAVASGNWERWLSTRL